MTHTCARTYATRVYRETRQATAVAPPPPSHEAIARLAYSYWEARGHRHGSSHEDWYRAEQELLRQQRSSEFPQLL